LSCCTDSRTGFGVRAADADRRPCRRAGQPGPHRTSQRPPRQAIAYYHQALDRYHAAGNTCGSADALSRLGQSYAAIAEHELARTAWREALAAFREQGRQEEADRVQQRLDMLRGEGSRASC